MSSFSKMRAFFLGSDDGVHTDPIEERPSFTGFIDLRFRDPAGEAVPLDWAKVPAHLKACLRTMEFSDRELRPMSLAGLKDCWAGFYAYFKESLVFTVDFKGLHLKTKADLCSALWAISQQLPIPDDAERAVLAELVDSKVSRKRKRDMAE